jgi:hypothetical protein
MTCKALVHMLGHETPRTMQELLDITTQYSTGEEVVEAIFSGKAKVAGHLSGGDGDDGPALSQQCHDRRNKDRKHHGEEMVVVADHATGPQHHR